MSMAVSQTRSRRLKTQRRLLDLATDKPGERFHQGCGSQKSIVLYNHTPSDSEAGSKTERTELKI